MAWVGLLSSYAFVVPPGLPYDEPSHWANVRYVAAHGVMPVLGTPEATYEAQMGPVAYYPYAAVRIVGSVATSDETALLLTTRLLGLLWMALLAVLTVRLVRRCLPSVSPLLRGLGVLVATANPVVVAVGMSVQNDLAAVVLAVAATLVATRAERTTTTAAVAGTLAGLSLLTKYTTWPVVAVLGMWLLWRGAPRRWVGTAAYSAAVLATSGWWFVRNAVLYGDPTARAAVERMGIVCPGTGWDWIGTPVAIARDIVTFLWLPVEYYRNAVNSPGWLAVGVTLATLAIPVAAARVLPRPNPAATVVYSIGGVGLVSWTLIAITVTCASFRLAYPCLMAWAVLATLALSRLRNPRSQVAVVLGVLAVVHAWVLIEMVQVGPGLSANLMAGP